MRKYDEPIEVQRGLVAGQEAPEQFLWRGRLWMVRDILAHWVETGAWWEQAGVAALLGAAVDTGTGTRTGTGTGSATTGSETPLGADLLGERDVWRVEAGRGRMSRDAGVFDLSFDWSDAQWRLVCCVD